MKAFISILCAATLSATAGFAEVINFDEASTGAPPPG